MTSQSAGQNYTQQMQRIARALAVANDAVVTSDVADDLATERVSMFTEGNLDKRFDKLRDQVELLEDVLSNLDELIGEYVGAVPLAAYDTGSSDGDRFAQWVARRIDPTADQRDLLSVIRSRYAVEEIARHNRLSHVRFQERLSMNERSLAELESNGSLRLYLNPIRLITHFESDLLLDEAGVDGADAVFFAVGTEIRVAVLDEDGQHVVAALARNGGLSQAELSGCIESSSGRNLSADQLLEIVTDTVALGLVALA